ncbi:hypothetical protein D3C77_411030 [compost metagenome]
MIIDKSKLQPLLWAVVGAWKAGDQDLHLHTDALDQFLGEHTVEEVALGLLAEVERLEGCEEVLRNLASYVGADAYSASEVAPEVFARKIMDGINILNDPLAQLAEKRGAERDQLAADNESLRGSCKAMGLDMGKLTRERNSFRRSAEKLKADNEVLRKALTECVDSLEGELLQKFGGQTPQSMHPVTYRSYCRDMTELAGYRAALPKGASHG